METGREICGETTVHFRIKREFEVEWEGTTSDKRKKILQEMATKWKRNWQGSIQTERKETKVVMASIKAEEFKKWERNKGKPKMKTELLKIHS